MNYGYPNNYNFRGQQQHNQGQMVVNGNGNMQYNQYANTNPMMSVNQYAANMNNAKMNAINTNLSSIINNINAMHQFVNANNANLNNQSFPLQFPVNNGYNAVYARQQYNHQYNNNTVNNNMYKQQSQNINYAQNNVAVTKQAQPQKKVQQIRQNAVVSVPAIIPKPKIISNGNYDSEETVKLKSALRWIIYNDQIDDYAQMLCTNDNLKIFVINQCAKHSSTQSACIRWSRAWNMANNPLCIDAVLHSMAKSKQNEIDRIKRTNREQKSIIAGFDDLKQCELNTSENVIFVNDRASFDEAAKILLAEKECIGLDMECLVKQFSSTPKRKICQILQVATTQKIILFDLEAVPTKYGKVKSAEHKGLDPIISKEFDDLMHGIFYDPNILKIGMSFYGDIKLLRSAYPYLSCFKCIIKNYFELELVLGFIRSKRGKRVFNVDDATEYKIKKKLSQSNVKKEGGLATIVRHVTKQRLLKKRAIK